MKRRTSKRQLLKMMGISAIGVSGLSSGISAEEPIEITEHPVGDLASFVATHPTKDLVAIVTPLFGDGFDLYLAEGPSTANEPADNITQLTESHTGVFDIEWKNGQTLQYWKDLHVYKRKITVDGKKRGEQATTKTGDAVSQDVQAVSGSEQSVKEQVLPKSVNARWD